MRKVLPVEYSTITSKPVMARFFACMEAHKERTMPFIADHYIQIAATMISDVYMYDVFNNSLYENPFFEIRKPSEINCNNFTDYIESYIKNEVYVSAELNQFYIKHSQDYRRRNQNHATFIYGFDNDTKQIMVADFYYGSKYSFEEISYEEIILCYKTAQPFHNDFMIHTFCQEASYEFNKDKMMQQLWCYLNSSPLKQNEENIFCYGLDCFNIVISKLVRDKAYDVRDIHFLYEHMKLMHIRICYLKEIGYPINYELMKSCTEIVKSLLTMRNLALKYNMQKNEALASGINNNCQQIHIACKHYVQRLIMCVE